MIQGDFTDVKANLNKLSVINEDYFRYQFKKINVMSTLHSQKN